MPDFRGSRLPALRILIIDDSRLDRAEAKAALLHGSARPYQFSEASTAEEGLRLCAAPPLPDCVVLDLGLPDADELGVLTRLPRDEDRLLLIPVVVLTGAVTHGLNQAALRAGAQDYVGKAWLRPESLTQAVENAIERLALTRTLMAQRRQAEGSRIRYLELESENRRIQESGRLQRQFLANMSHELRTPLSAVIGFADLLHEQVVPPGSPKQLTFLGHIRTGGRHLLRLINDVLDLSKIEADKVDFHPEPLDLAQLVGEVRDVLSVESQLKGLEVVVEIDAGLGPLLLDPMRLRQVLYNYLSNAIKFTADGGRVTVRGRMQGARHFRLEVEDTGIGISADDMPSLFSEYRQLDGGLARLHQGTGLGLALTRRLVEAQNGTVGVDSTLQVGSVFHLVLNRVHGTDAIRKTADSGRKVMAPGQRILVIQNEHASPTRLAQSLMNLGFLVEAAVSGDWAVRRARGRAYDGIAIDLLPPDQCGLGILQRIRHGGLSRSSPVVALSMTLEPGLAATFAIADLMLEPICSDEIRAAVTRFRQPGSSPTNVMVIDDDPVSMDSMLAILKTLDIDAVRLCGGCDVLRDIDRHRPDAIILSLVMPDFDGFEVLGALRQLPTWRDTPVFVCTGPSLSDAEYAGLGRSARMMLDPPGGSFDSKLVALRP